MNALRTGVTRGLKNVCARKFRRKKVGWNDANRDLLAAVTFDEAPTGGITPVMVGILPRHQTPATFFLQGNHVEHHP
jgi:peptidoglycan/xylan/chitin deacetylase (PgdA/CDA1 family)